MSFQESTVGKVVCSVPITIILLLGTVVGLSGWGYHEYKDAREEAISTEDNQKYPFNEAVWYGLYTTEVNVNYYNLADDTRGFKARWLALGRKYKALKDNPNVTQKWIDCLYMERWNLEKEETTPPIMSLLHQAQAIANETAVLRWQQEVTPEEQAAVADWLASKIQ